MNLLKGDCLELMKDIPSGSIDAVICDPPYGTTACKWDSVIPFDEMWKELKRVIKPKGAIVLFGSEPFSSALRMSNIKDYKYDWVWNKRTSANVANAKYQPLKNFELVSVFNLHNYYPQMVKGKKRMKGGKVKGGFHPTQKPVELMEYLIKTYTLEGEHVLDFTMGSGSTGVACVNTGRNFTGIEQDENYFQISKARIAEASLKSAESLL